MSDKKLNAIKEIEFRVNRVKELANCDAIYDINKLKDILYEIDSTLFDINDFINDLKDKDETN